MIGERIKHFRTKNKFTQEELAIVLGVKRKDIIDWEKGTTNPSKENLSLLSDFFGVDINELKVDFKDKDKKIVYVHRNTKRNLVSIFLFILGLLFVTIGLGIILTSIIIYFTNDIYLYYHLVEALTIIQLKSIFKEFTIYSIIFIVLGIISFLLRFFIIHFKKIKKEEE